MKVNRRRFIHNNLYEGHGTAIYFSSTNSNLNNTQLLFTINNSNFSKNKQCQSIVFIRGCNNDKSHQLFLRNSAFVCNQVITFYILNQILHVVGNVTFENNTAEYGAGFFVSNHSTITFSKSIVVTFDQNIANDSGGAILLTHYSRVIFEANSVTTFSNNTANQHCGGSIYSYNNSDILLIENSGVQFSKNVAKSGGALCIEINSTFKVINNSLVTFISNEADFGGSVYFTSNYTVEFNNKKSFIVFHTIAIFYDNKARYGGAIYIKTNLLFDSKKLL